MSWDILPKGNLQYFLQKLKGKLDLKVDAVSGKGLSTNDFTTTEKNKLAGIEAGAQVNPTIDSALSDSSTNAVQNKVVKAALDGKAGREEIPTKVSQLTNDSGYTTNTGTVTQVKVGSVAYNPSSGVVSLPSYPAAVAVKGNAESTYRTGNVNITPANIGLGNVNNTADSSKNVNSANKVNYTEPTPEGTLVYQCEVEGELSNSEDKIPNSAAVVDYLNSNFATKKYYADYLDGVAYNANTNIAIPTNSAVTADTSNNTFRFIESGVYILIFHIAIKINGTTGRSWIKFINNTSNTTLISSIHYGEYATHDFVFVARITSDLVFRLVTVENIVIDGGGIGPSYMETIKIS